MIFINYQWEYNFTGLNTFYRTSVTRIKLATKAFVSFQIFHQLPWNEITRGRIIEELSVQCVKIRKKVIKQLQEVKNRKNYPGKILKETNTKRKHEQISINDMTKRTISNE
jgi:hypothetical protein